MDQQKRKRGRPKKIMPITETSPLPTSGTFSNVEASVTLEQVEAQAQAAVEEIDRTGKDDMRYYRAAESPIQQDFLPGTKLMRADPSYVPETIEVNGDRRRVYNPIEYKLRWVSSEKVNHWKLAGFNFFPYSPIFSGSGLYEKDQDGHIVNGDTRLMYAPMRAWEAIQADIQKQKDLYENVARTDFANTGYKSGIRTFQEFEGGRIDYD